MSEFILNQTQMRYELKSQTTGPHLSSSSSSCDAYQASEDDNRSRSIGVHQEDRSWCEYQLKHVQVYELDEDEDGRATLGLLLSRCEVKGFHSNRAKLAGWQVGDLIVDVNGRLVHSFQQFKCAFHAAKDEGFPIDFAVLRKGGGADETADDLRDFFDGLEWEELQDAVPKLRSFSASDIPLPADAKLHERMVPQQRNFGMFNLSDAFRDTDANESAKKNITRRPNLSRA